MNKLLISTFGAFALLSISSLTFAQQSSSELDQLFNQIDAKAGTSATATAPATTTTTVAAPTKVLNAANISIDGISHTYQGNNYTVTWKPIDGSYSVDVFLKNLDIESDYSKIGTVKASEGKINFKISEKGNYTVKLVPIDADFLPAGPEKTYTIKVESVDQPATTAAPTTTSAPAQPVVIEKAAQVGPASDVMVGILVVIATLYAISRFRANMSE